ncbi:MAG: hypothetical protein AAF730_00740, partial [Bacteroidota bacterium]
MRRFAFAVLLVALAIFPASAQAQYTNANAWTTEFTRLGVQGEVFVAKQGPDGHYYVGGRFFTINSIPNTRNIARWNTTTNAWEALGLGVIGEVHDLDFLSDGSPVIVGQVGSVYSTTGSWFNSGRMARWDEAAGRWRSVGQETTQGNQWGANSLVSAVAIDANDQIYIGGGFTSVRINGAEVRASRLARFDYTNQTWHALGVGATATDNGVNSVVSALAFDTDGSLIFGGAFTEGYPSAGTTVSLSRLGRWTPSTSTLSALGDGSNATRNGVQGSVLDLKRAADGTLYVYVSFGVGYNADGTTVSLTNVGGWNNGVWSNLSGGTGGRVGFFLDQNNNDLIAVGSTTGNGMARWTASTLTWGAALPGSAGLAVRDINAQLTPRGGFADGDDLIVFGAFVTGFQPDGTEVWADHILRWDGTNTMWTVLGTAPSHNGLEIGRDIRQGAAMATRGNDLFVAAYAEYAGTTRIANFGRYDRVNQQWHALGSLLGASRIESMAVWGDRIVITGQFGSVRYPSGGSEQTVQASNIVAWNTITQQFEAFGDGSNGSRNGLGGRVNDVTVLPNGDLVAVGSFTTARQSDGATLPTQRVAVWDATASQWRTLTGTNDSNNGSTAELLAVAVDASGAIVVGGRRGNLRNPDGSTTGFGRVARWTGTAWALYGSDNNNSGVHGFSDFVETLAVVGNDLYIGGQFSQLKWGGGSINTNDIGRWDGARWNAVGNLPEDTNVHLLVPYGGDLFASTGDTKVAHIKYFNGSSWSDVGGQVLRNDPRDVVSHPRVNDMALAGGTLYAVGDFAQVGNIGASMMAAYPNLQPPNSIASTIITAPTDGTTGLAVAPTVTWQATPFATAYDLQISPNADYSTPTVDQSGLTGTSYTAMGLAPNTLYYLRLRSRNGGTVSNWSAVSFLTTATILPPAPILASPADAATATALRPAFRWNPADQAVTYQLQVASDNGFTTLTLDEAAIADTSRTPDANVAGVSSTGFWRVRGVNNLGVGAWSQVFSFTTAEVDLPVSMSPFPADGTPNWNAGFPWFQWSNASNALNELQVFDAVDMSTPVGTALVMPLFTNFYRIFGAAEVPFTLTTGTTYRWRTRALDDSNPGPPLAGPWSEFFTFTTGGTHPDAPTVAPTLGSPANQAEGVLFQPTLTWNASASADTYEVQISRTSSSFFFDDVGNLVESAEGSGLSHTLATTLDEDTRYYWRVRGKNARGDSPWSTIWRFDTAPFGAPTLLAPANGSTGHPVIDHTLSWQAFDAANHYWVQVSTDPTFATVLAAQQLSFNESDPADTSTPRTYTLTAVLTQGTTYYWRVQARRGTTWGAWSAPWSFVVTTEPAPTETISLLWPEDGNSSGLYFLGTWIPSASFTRYQVQVAPDATFDEENTRTLMSNQPFTGDDFYQSGTHHWRVRVLGPTGFGPWSASRTFMAGGPSNVPIIPTPHGSRSVPINGSVAVRNAVSGEQLDDVTSCTYEIATDDAFSTIVLTQAVAGSADQVLPITGLSLETAYYIRSLCDVSGTPSLYSPTGWFSTGDGIPDAPPTLLTPADEATGISTYPTYTWQPAPEAAQYRLQVSSDAGFGTTVLDHTTTGAPTAFFSTASLDAFTTYHWRVMALGSVGNSAWSTAWSFTTGPPSPATPMLTFPANSATEVLTGLTFTWNAIAGANRFQIQVRTLGQDWEEAILNFTTGVNTPLGNTFTTNTLNVNTTYEWRVRGLIGDPITSSGDWSPVWRFTTYDPPPPAGPPTLLTPSDNATDVSTNPTFTWSAVANAASYQLQVSTNSSFSSGLLTRTPLVPTFSFTGLSASQTYYWRVRAVNPAGTSAYSDAFQFTTNAVAAPLPVAFNYRSQGSLMAQNPRIWWTASVGATSYDFQLAIDANFNNLAVDETGLTGL